jgi:hypothetical protein
MNVVSINSSNLISLDELTNKHTGAYVNDATVTATLRDSDLAAVSGGSNLAMSYVAASNGQYHGTLPPTVVLEEHATYYLDITATSGSLVLFARLPCRAQYDRGKG